MAKKFGKILKAKPVTYPRLADSANSAKSVKGKICRKPDGLQKEIIWQSVADLISKMSCRKSQAVTIGIDSYISSIIAAASSSPTDDGSSPSHQPTTSQHSGQPAAATSNTPNSMPADPSITNPESYTLQALEENINFEELQPFVDENSNTAYFNSDQIMQDFLDKLNLEDFNFSFKFDERILFCTDFY